MENLQKSITNAERILATHGAHQNEIENVSLKSIAAEVDTLKIDSVGNSEKCEILLSKISRVESDFLSTNSKLSRSDRSISEIARDVALSMSVAEQMNQQIGSLKISWQSLQDDLECLSRRLDAVSEERLEESRRLDIEIASRLQNLENTNSNIFESFTKAQREKLNDPPKRQVLDSLIFSVQRYVVNLKHEKLVRDYQSRMLLAWNVERTVSRGRKAAARSIIRTTLCSVRRCWFAWLHHDSLVSSAKQLQINIDGFRDIILNKADRYDMDEKLSRVEVSVNKLVTDLNVRLTNVEGGISRFMNVEILVEDLAKTTVPELNSRVGDIQEALKLVESNEGRNTVSLHELVNRQDELENLIRETQSKTNIPVEPPVSPNSDHSQQIFTDVLLLWNFVKQLEKASREVHSMTDILKLTQEMHGSEIREFKNHIDRISQQLRDQTARGQVSTKEVTDNHALRRPKSAILTRTSSSTTAHENSTIVEYVGLHARGKAVSSKRPVILPIRSMR